MNEDNRLDCLVVGSGLTGAVIARVLKDAGKRVMVVERRAHLGGNVHDHRHESGVRVHTYGPHYFRTNSPDLWSFVNRFASFYRYEPALKSLVDGRLENWPIAASYIRRAVGDWTPAFSGVPTNFEEAALSMMPRLVYERFVKGYTEKQWGVPATTLSPQLAGRFDVRVDDDPRLVRHTYQGIPSDGYAAFMSRMLEGIQVAVGCDYLKERGAFGEPALVVFTGPIDEWFEFDLGRLSYRGQQRRLTYLPDVDFAQPCGQVNNPDPGNGPHVRTLEWKHMMPPADAAAIQGTVLTTETPYSPVDPSAYEYPFPDSENANLYRTYRDRAAVVPNLLICGRLGEFKYYDMDQAIARALMLAKRILERRVPVASS